ncbi:hypothetical protein [Actinoplanes derwentensis]|uniref:hypothetical protein n=1 Tax=Actinoplanes derwentensis TaxID=113562 RepID=UPI001A4205A7|nr:hypothetical protein [Actinoplanes derwentensis]GID85875.1 hypothetical protein Ade03nite_47990 [Actinoplanes derwentensis]
METTGWERLRAGPEDRLGAQWGSGQEVAAVFVPLLPEDDEDDEDDDEEEDVDDEVVLEDDEDDVDGVVDGVASDFLAGVSLVGVAGFSALTAPARESLR